MIALQTPPEASPSRLDDIATRLRSDGIYVIELRRGRSPDLARSIYWIAFGGAVDRASPNDLLEQARQAAGAQVDWIHALLEDYKAAMALILRLPAQFQGPVRRPYRHPTRTRRQTPASARDIFGELVAQTPISARMIVQAASPHIVEFPEPWLDLL